LLYSESCISQFLTSDYRRKFYWYSNMLFWVLG
jgi:hypothetical protein